MKRTVLWDHFDKFCNGPHRRGKNPPLSTLVELALVVAWVFVAAYGGFCSIKHGPKRPIATAMWQKMPSKPIPFGRATMYGIGY